ncbi:MAG: threonine/serine exporter family protein [Erysipelotrichaceae bacterium]
MSGYVIKLIGAFFGSMGFGYLFHVRKRNLFIGSCGGVIGIVIYLFCSDFLKLNVFMTSFLAGFGCDLYSEIMARVFKAPSTTFFMVAFLPLVPGGSLYYCIENIVSQNNALAWQYGVNTFLTALGIALGMSIGWALCDLFRKISSVRKKQLGN